VAGIRRQETTMAKTTTTKKTVKLTIADKIGKLEDKAREVLAKLKSARLQTDPDERDADLADAANLADEIGEAAGRLGNATA
jgi:hypothetical protein